jgi:hypothetical protein
VSEVGFITYTKGTVQYVTISKYESQFLDWLNGVGDSSGYKRETTRGCGVRCRIGSLHETTKKEATILTLIKREAE